MSKDKIIKAIAGRIGICIGILAIFLGGSCVITEIYFHFNANSDITSHTIMYIDVMNQAAILAAIFIIAIFILEPLVLGRRRKTKNENQQNCYNEDEEL